MDKCVKWLLIGGVGCALALAGCVCFVLFLAVIASDASAPPE